MKPKYYFLFIWVTLHFLTVEDAINFSCCLPKHMQSLATIREHAVNSQNRKDYCLTFWADQLPKFE